MQISAMSSLEVQICIFLNENRYEFLRRNNWRQTSDLFIGHITVTARETMAAPSTSTFATVLVARKPQEQPTGTFYPR